MESLQERAYNSILSDIVTLRYLPGERISDRELVKSLNISRTPVREAILRLKQKGLINVIPQSGTFITKIDLHKAQSACFVRENVEKEIVRKCVGMASESDIASLKKMVSEQQKASKIHNIEAFFCLDNQFHQYFYQIIDESIIWHWLQDISIQFTRYRWLRVKEVQLPWEMLIQGHMQIIRSVENHDQQQAGEFASHHLSFMLDEQKVLLDEFPGFFTNVSS